MKLSTTSTEYLSPPAFLDSKNARFVRGGVTIDSDDVSADGDGNKIVAAGTILYKQTAGTWKEITSGALDHSMVFSILAERADVTDGDGTFNAVEHARVKEAQMTPTPATADKEYLGKQFVFV